MEKSDLEGSLSELKERIVKAKEIINPTRLKGEILELEKKTFASDFWNDKENAQKILKKLERLKKIVQKWDYFYQEASDLYDLYKMAKEENDTQTLNEIEKRKNELEKDFSEEEIKIFLSEVYDKNNAYLSIHAGTGGKEACDWAGMLLRMYLRFAEKMGFFVKIIDENREEDGGIKNATLFIEGDYAYGFLKGEFGTHRLVRISPFDADKARHTSFALVEVMPEIEETDFKIKEEDLKIETFRSSGPGGQHANVTASAVRITHLPTKITVVCQSERSQHQNKMTALQILKARLQHYYQQEKEKEKEKIKNGRTLASWGTQIRSYILHPYKLVKDHRTLYESTNPDEVLDGDILPFIEAYLRQFAKSNFK